MIEPMNGTGQHIPEWANDWQSEWKDVIIPIPKDETKHAPYLLLINDRDTPSYEVELLSFRSLHRAMKYGAELHDDSRTIYFTSKKKLAGLVKRYEWVKRQLDHDAKTHTSGWKAVR